MSADPMDGGPCQSRAHAAAEPGGGPCPRCGRPRCCATAKSRDGERCRKNPHPGATICTNHGLTKAGRAAAEQRRAEAKAEGLLKLIWDPEAEPVTNPVASLMALAGKLQHAVDVLGARVDGEDLDGPTALAWVRVLRELRQSLEGLERLGLEERQTQVTEDAGRQLASVVRAVLERLGLTVEQQALARVVVPEEFRRLAGGDVVAGEVAG